MFASSPSVFSRFHRWLSGTHLQRILSQHPRGLYLLCLVVTCERWAASILSSLVVLMLGERYGFSRGDSLRLAGLYSAASYFLTLPGGLVLDRLLGAKRALGLGMGLLLLGYAALSQSLAAALESRLTPVLREPEPSQIRPDNPGIASAQSAFGAMLRQRVQEAESIAYRLSSIMRRLEI